MITIEPCRGCGRPLGIHKIANLTVRLEIEPLDGPKATQALLDGRELWRVTQTSVSAAKPDVLAALVTAEPGERPHVVQTHRCTAAGAPVRPSPVPSGQRTPPRPPVGRATRSSGPQTAPSSARSAGRRRSDRPFGGGRPVPCEHCGADLNDDVLNAIVVELGATVMTAFHSEPCERKA